MKNKNILDLLNLADDKYVIAANPENVSKTIPKPSAKVKRTRVTISIAACFLILFFGFILIYNDLGKPYAKISQNLQVLNGNNIFHQLISEIIPGRYYYNMDNSIDYSIEAIEPSYNVTQKYEEITDNQVSGVIEEDLIKRSDKYIYYLHRPDPADGNMPTLAVYSIDGENSEKVGKYRITERYNGTNTYVKGFYLSEDCTRITLIISYAYVHKDYNYSLNTELISLDVSDPQNIRELNRITILGRYYSSRLVDGNILLFSVYSVDNDYDIKDEHSFVPHIDKGEGFEIIPADNIVVPDHVTNSNYTVISMINEENFEIKDTVAYFSTIALNPYVSANNIYIYRSYSESTDEKTAEANKNGKSYKAVTEIFKISYTNDDLDPLKSVVVDGIINSQYWLDEYNGILRAVTSTKEIHKRNLYSSADLYCIDVEKMKIVSSVKQFAPQGESVQSVRFDGDSAYVCTAVVITLTDPVFFFDLSDIENITCTDTGDIDGYSHSLVDFGNGLCLGIGFGNRNDTLKIEIYQKGEEFVESLCCYEIENSDFSTDYKAYLIDRDNKLIGFGIKDYSSNDPKGPTDLYLLLHFDGEKLELIRSIDIEGAPDYKRAVLIDGYLYVFGKSSFKVEKISF